MNWQDQLYQQTFTGNTTQSLLAPANQQQLTSSSYIPPSYPFNSIFDINKLETTIKENVNIYKEFKKSLEIIENLHAKTRELLEVINSMNSIEDYKKLDYFVRKSLFKNELNQILEENPNE